MSALARALSFSVACIGLAGVGCGASNPPPSPPEPPPAPAPAPAAPAVDTDAFRRTAPQPGPEKAYVAPKIVEARLSNGVRVLFVERHEMPIVALQVIFDRGADQTRPGLASFATGLLSAGTPTKNALQISDSFLALGARQGSWASYDGTFVSLQVLSAKLTPALELLSDVVRNASFPQAEVQRELPRRLNAIAQQKDSPGIVHSNVIADALFGPKHAYGTSLLGTEASMKYVSAGELRAFHRAQLRPDHMTVTAAGDITREALLAALEPSFGTWTGKAAPAARLPDPAPPSGKARILLVDRPQATQSHVALADIGVPRKTPDYDALVVLNTILGGQFSSRLNLNLREAHAYTYGAGSSFDMRRNPGPFRTSGAIVREATAPAVTEMWREIERIRNEPVTEEELAAAQAYLVRRLPARFETAAATADALSALAIYELPLDEYATYPARISRVTRADIQRVAKTYLRPERLRIIVLGDAITVRPALEALKIGDVELRTPN